MSLKLSALLISLNDNSDVAGFPIRISLERLGPERTPILFSEILSLFLIRTDNVFPFLSKPFEADIIWVSSLILFLISSKLFSRVGLGTEIINKSFSVKLHSSMCRWLIFGDFGILKSLTCMKVPDLT